MNKLCCISLSAAARIIGTYTMSLSILMINVLMSNYFSRICDEGFFEAAHSWAPVGLNWMQALRNSQLQKKTQTAMACFLLYTILFLLASVYLALGSISRKPKSAVPWMYLQMISIIDQSVALVIHLTHGPEYNEYDKSLWYIPSASVYLLVSAYFWMVVQSARGEWASCNDSQNREDCVHRVTTASFPVTTSNEPKTPSFLSQSFSMFESPRPPTILPK